MVQRELRDVAIPSRTLLERDHRTTTGTAGDFVPLTSGGIGYDGSGDGGDDE